MLLEIVPQPGEKHLPATAGVFIEVVPIRRGRYSGLYEAEHGDIAVRLEEVLFHDRWVQLGRSFPRVNEQEPPLRVEGFDTGDSGHAFAPRNPIPSTFPRIDFGRRRIPADDLVRIDERLPNGFDRRPDLHAMFSSPRVLYHHVHSFFVTGCAPRTNRYRRPPRCRDALFFLTSRFISRASSAVNASKSWGLSKRTSVSSD